MSEPTPDPAPPPPAAPIPPPTVAPNGNVMPSPRPSARSAKKTEVSARRRKVAALHLSRVPQREIAKRLGVSETLISRDLDTIRERWTKEYISDHQKLKLRELAALDQDETRARSRLVNVPDADFKNFVKVQEIVLKIMDRRAKLLGLDAPQKVEASGQATLRVEFVNDWQSSPAVEVVAHAIPADRNGNGEPPPADVGPPVA